MGESILILTFVVIVIGGIGSIRGALVGPCWWAWWTPSAGPFCRRCCGCFFRRHTPTASRPPWHPCRSIFSWRPFWYGAPGIVTGPCIRFVPIIGSFEPQSLVRRYRVPPLICCQERIWIPRKAGVAARCVAGMAGEPYLVTLFSRILIYALAAVSLDLMLGFGGMVSLGHAAFFGIGAYVVCICPFMVSRERPAHLALRAGRHQSGLVLWPAAVLLFPLRPPPCHRRPEPAHQRHAFYHDHPGLCPDALLFFVSLEAYGGDDGISLFSRNTFAGYRSGRRHVNSTTCAWLHWPPFSFSPTGWFTPDSAW
jgi:hypothetical protein